MERVIIKKLLLEVPLSSLGPGSNNKLIEERNPGTGQLNVFYHWLEIDKLKEEHGVEHVFINFNHHEQKLQFWGCKSIAC